MADLPASGHRFYALDGRLDRRFGDDAQRLGAVVFVTLQFQVPDAVRVGLDRERGNRGFRSERTAHEPLAGRAGVSQDLATGEEQEHADRWNTKDRALMDRGLSS